jgi:hypothetical protein
MRGTMYRAEVEPIPDNPPDRTPFSGLQKVGIYEGDRFVRSAGILLDPEARTRIVPYFPRLNVLKTIRPACPVIAER